MTMISGDLLDAFTELNDAALAMTTCQLAQATEAGQRLEVARKRFQSLFMQAVKASAVAARDNV
jgi:hypothetical protein